MANMLLEANAAAQTIARCVFHGVVVCVCMCVSVDPRVLTNLYDKIVFGTESST